MALDPKLYEYATPRQRDYLDAIAEHGNPSAANKALGLAHDVVGRSIRALHAEAARRGYAPGHFQHGTAPGFSMGKVTIQRSGDGTVERVWERQHPDQANLMESLRAAVDAMAAEIKPEHPIPAPPQASASLLSLYSFFDYHVGMLAWHREGGADWDLQIAETTGSKAMSALVGGSPNSDTAVVNIGGDFLHFDGLAPVTPTHGHILDADSRFGKVVDVAIRLIRKLVSLTLQKHNRVILLIQEGNHDLASSLWLRKLFAALYEHEPRVSVHDSELPYYAMAWGKTMLAFHHGHLRKNDDLPLLFAAQFSEIWGATSKRYAHTGHRHHEEVKEHSGMTVRQHPTLSARDAYAARGGWQADRKLIALHYHKAHGEVASNAVSPEMLA